MAAWSEMSTGARGGVVLAAGAVVAAVIYGMTLPAPVAVPEVAAVPAALLSEPPAPEVTAPEVTAASVGPRLDVVRIGRDGTVSIAGRAGPGDAVRFDLDGAEVARTQATASGDFVGLFTIPASDLARILSVIVEASDGSTQTADVAIAAFAAAQAEVAAAPLAALVLDPTGVRVVPTTALPAEVAANIRIESITYGEDGAVVLGGRGTGGSDLQVYLDQAPVARAVIAASGDWSVVLRGVVAGRYTLRVDQLGADGKVVSRFETPFQRETLEALAAAAATEPAAVAMDAKPAAVIDGQPSAQAAPPTEPAPTLDVAVNAPELTAPTGLPAPLEPGAAVARTAISVTVQPGFTLWGIAQKEFGDGYMYVQVFDANKERIKNPDLIYPGQVFLIPGSP